MGENLVRLSTTKSKWIGSESKKALYDEMPATNNAEFCRDLKRLNSCRFRAVWGYDSGNNFEWLKVWEVVIDSISAESGGKEGGPAWTRVYSSHTVLLKDPLVLCNSDTVPLFMFRRYRVRNSVSTGLFVVFVGNSHHILE